MMVEFKYEIGERVRLKDISTLARVDSRMQSKDGIEYRVIYWNDGCRNVSWVYDWEIAEVQ